MIREPKNNFDEHIKEALQGFEMPFEPNDWALMEQNLNKEANKAGLVLFFSNKYLQVGIAAALLLCVLYNVSPWLTNSNTSLAKYDMTTNQTSLPNTSHQTAATQDLSEQQIAWFDTETASKTDIRASSGIAKAFSLEEEKTDMNTHWSENHKQSASIFDISPSNKAKTNNTITAYEQKNTLITNNETISLDKKETSEQFAATTSSTFAMYQPSQTANIHASSISDNETYKNAGLPISNNVAVIVSDDMIASQNVNHDNIITVKPTAANNLIFPLANKNVNLIEENNEILAAAIKTAQPLSDFSSVIKTPKVPKKKADMSVAWQSSLDINFLEASFPELGLTTGLGFQMGKNKRWGFQTGAFYTYKNYPTHNLVEETAVLSSASFLESQDEAYTVNSSHAVTIEKRYDLFSIRAFFLEIPLLITHNFKPEAPINPYISAGISLWLPTSLQKTNYKSQTIATYDYVTALQNLNDRSNAEQHVNVRNPSFAVSDITTIGGDSTSTEFSSEIEPNYINTIPDYYTSVNEEAVNQTVGKSRAYWDILQIQAGLDVELSKRWTFQLAGQLKGSLFKHALNRHAIQNLSSVDKRLNTIGIQFGLTCAL